MARERTETPTPAESAGPVRTCVGCRAARPPGELIRFALVDGVPRPAPGPGGRGAWLCPDEACFDLAVKRRSFGRALRADVPPEALEELRNTLRGTTRFRSPHQS